jgi:hypothetical protein
MTRIGPRPQTAYAIRTPSLARAKPIRWSATAPPYAASGLPRPGHRRAGYVFGANASGDDTCPHRRATGRDRPSVGYPPCAPAGTTANRFHARPRRTMKLPQGNGLVLAVLRSPAHRLLSGTAIELRYVGRRSAREYVLPVQYARTGEQLVVQPQAVQRSTWWRNFRTPRSSHRAPGRADPHRHRPPGRRP